MDPVRQFSDAFAVWTGAGFAVGFWKARVALYAILRAMGVGEADEIVLPGYTCVMDVNPIKYLGARPVYVDIEPNTFNIDVHLLEKAITPRTKVIIAQHTYGYPCEMDAILSIANRHGIPIIEDCCHALGSTYKGRMCGTFGLATYWSFQWNKPFTTGLGGMATVNDKVLAGKVADLCQRHLQSPSAKATWMLAAQRAVYRSVIYPSTTALSANVFRWLVKKGVIVGSSSMAEFTPTMASGFFTGISASQARSGLRQMKKIQMNIAHRQRMGRIYDELLREAGWSVRAVPEYMDPVLVRYPVRVADKPRAVEEAPGQFVELGTWFECPLHPIETPLGLYDYCEGMCPEAEKASREVVNLPTHPRASEKAARRSVVFLGRIGQPDSP